jgi:hypothetical protein
LEAHVSAAGDSRLPLPLDAAGDRQTFFKDGGVDQLLSMVLELAAELWVVRERVYRLEAAGAVGGVPLRELAESLDLDADQQAELAAMRETFLRGMFRSLNRSAAT